ncbi:MAG: efflux RND transporter periplasmic adaptor subunit [Pseudomonadota bacterium]|nr:efflux RND transporter periplasmic adaptor subunit [Pseudomonadota bacterium]
MQVSVSAVRTEALKRTVPVIGRFVAQQAGIVAARIGGPVGELKVEVGDRVATGDIIAVLVKDLLQWDQELLKAEVQQYDAAVKTRRAQIKWRQQELRRLEKLKQSAAFSKASLEDKRQEVAVSYSQAAEAEGRLARARASLRLTEIKLSYATVKAPYSGVVTQRHTEVGSFVRIGDPLVSLIDDQHLEIEADVPANRLAGLDQGRALRAEMDSGSELTAIIRAVIPDENPRTRTRRVRLVAEFSGEKRSIAANQSVTVHVPAGEFRNVLTVHKDAVIERKGRKLVYVAKADRAEIRPVTLGEAVGSRFVVLRGLKVGDLVVVRGNERLRPGQQILYNGQVAKPASAGGQG